MLHTHHVICTGAKVEQKYIVLEADGMDLVGKVPSGAYSLTMCSLPFGIGSYPGDDKAMDRAEMTNFVANNCAVNNAEEYSFAIIVSVDRANDLAEVNTHSL